MMFVLLLSLLSGKKVTGLLPSLTYKYASFAAADPESAAEFLAKYTEGLSFSCTKIQALCAGVRLSYESTWSTIYFVRDDSLPGNATAFGNRVASSFTMANDDWVWWQDWHIAFTVSDIDAVAMRLMKDDVPFISRGSLYFSVLNTGVTIQVLGSPTVYWTEHFLFCRETNNLTAAMKPYPLNVTPIVINSTSTYPEFIPSHQSLATSNAQVCGEWFQRVLNVSEVDENTEVGGSHAFAGGTCAKIKWYEIEKNGWETHFIQQFKKRDGGTSIPDTEILIRQLNGPNLQDNAFQQFRVGLSVSSITDLSQYIEHFDFIQEPYRLIQDEQQNLKYQSASSSFSNTTSRLRIAAPSGYIFEIFVESSSSLNAIRQW